MLAMFSVFTVLFVKDGLWAYRKDNLHYFIQKNFERAGVIFQENKGGVADDESTWKKYASEQVCEFPKNADKILPKEVKKKMPWPSILVDGYKIMKEKGGQNGANQLWVDYTAKKGWDAKTVKHPYDEGKINQQFGAATVTGGLVIITLFVLLRTLRRSIRVDHEALYTQDGRKILFKDMVRIDKRRWDTKGLATIYYKEGGVEKKAKIDGMVYGQFKVEDGAPAEALFARVMEHFKGEVLEYVVEDEDDVDCDKKPADEVKGVQSGEEESVKAKDV